MSDTDPAEDMDLFLRLGEVGRMVVLDEPLTMYREHLNKVGHTRARRQGEACHAMPRRGPPAPRASSRPTRSAG